MTEFETDTYTQRALGHSQYSNEPDAIRSVAFATLAQVEATREQTAVLTAGFAALTTQVECLAGATRRHAAAAEDVAENLAALTGAVRVGGAGLAREIRDACLAVTENMVLGAGEVSAPLRELAEHTETVSVAAGELVSNVGYINDVLDGSDQPFRPNVLVRTWRWVVGYRVSNLTEAYPVMPGQLAPGEEFAVEVVSQYGTAFLDLTGSVKDLRIHYPISSGYRLRPVVVAMGCGMWKVRRYLDAQTVADVETQAAAEGMTAEAPQEYLFAKSTTTTAGVSA